MSRWLWWVPLGALLLGAAGLGFRWGMLALSMTETDVINAYAQRYLEDRARDGSAAGASLAECQAYPGDAAGVWLVISCGPVPHDASRHYEYHVDRLGRLRFSGGPHGGGATPPGRQAPGT